MATLKGFLGPGDWGRCWATTRSCLILSPERRCPQQGRELRVLSAVNCWGPRSPVPAPSCWGRARTLFKVVPGSSPALGHQGTWPLKLAQLQIRGLPRAWGPCPPPTPSVGHFNPLTDTQGSTCPQTFLPCPLPSPAATSLPHPLPDFLSHPAILGQNVCCVFKWAEVAGRALLGYCID